MECPLNRTLTTEPPFPKLLSGQHSLQHHYPARCSGPIPSLKGKRDNGSSYDRKIACRSITGIFKSATIAQTPTARFRLLSYFVYLPLWGRYNGVRLRWKTRKTLEFHAHRLWRPASLLWITLLTPQCSLLVRYATKRSLCKSHFWMKNQPRYGGSTQIVTAENSVSPARQCWDLSTT
jgi:hypothetical protein